MPTQVQFRRGSTNQNDNFTGAAGELSVNSDINSLRVHDGTTAGGHELAKADLSNISAVGVITATSFIGIGSSITQLDADNISLGTLAIARGGTNSTASPSSGAVAYGDGTSYAFTSVGSTGQILQSNGDSAPSWIINGIGIATASGLVGVGVTLIDFRGTAVSSISPVDSGISTVTLIGGGGGGGGDNIITILSRAGIGITVSAPSSALTVYGRITNTIISI